jgi:hypothetical protein
VTLSLGEIPDLDHHEPLIAVADASGNVANTEFSPDEHDKGIRFMPTAVGAASEAPRSLSLIPSHSGRRPRCIPLSRPR